MVAAIARFRLQYSPRPRSGGGRGAGCEPRRARNAERRTGAATQRQDRERGAHSAGDESRAGGLGRRDRAPDPPAHPTRSLRAHRSSVDSTDYFHQLRYDTRLSNSTAHLRHTLYAWAPPSPRVRLHEAYLTYLLTPGSVSPLPSATQTRSHVRRHSLRSPYRDAIGWYSTTNQSCASGWPARPAGWPGTCTCHQDSQLVARGRATPLALRSTSLARTSHILVHEVIPPFQAPTSLTQRLPHSDGRLERGSWQGTQPTVGQNLGADLGTDLEAACQGACQGTWQHCGTWRHRRSQELTWAARWAAKRAPALPAPVPFQNGTYDLDAALANRRSYHLRYCHPHQRQTSTWSCSCSQPATASLDASPLRRSC
jgi:hypothetical protein